MFASLHEPCAGEPRTARIEIAAAAAFLPVTAEMAWTVPQLLKRVRLVAPDIRSTTDVLRAVIRMPECDEQFVQAFTDSGFFSCDQAIGRVRWKLDIDEMTAMYRNASASQVLAHCRSLLARDGGNEPFDWEAVLAELRMLRSWFPDLRTIERLERLYTRLHVLHIDSVHVARRWLDRPAGASCTSPGVHHA